MSKTSENLQLYMKYNNIPEIKKTGTSKDLPASRQKLLRFAARWIYLRKQWKRKCAYGNKSTHREGLKTKDLFFVALQDRLTVIKPKELNKNEIKIVGYVDVEQGDFTGIQKNCIYLGKGNDRIPFDVYNKNGLKIVGYIPVEGENAYIAVVKPMSPVFVILFGTLVAVFLIALIALALSHKYVMPISETNTAVASSASLVENTDMQATPEKANWFPNWATCE